jgi:hypothetical protein
MPKWGLSHDAWSMQAGERLWRPWQSPRQTSRERIMTLVHQKICLNETPSGTCRGLSSVVHQSTQTVTQAEWRAWKCVAHSESQCRQSPAGWHHHLLVLRPGLDGTASEFGPEISFQISTTEKKTKERAAAKEITMQSHGSSYLLRKSNWQQNQRVT